MYKGANWNTLIKKVPNCTPEEAKRIARQNPEISFFFFCREAMILENLGNEGIFNPGDAVFFSGEPWLGNAPQCDSYQKTGMSVVYVSLDKLLTTGCYTMEDTSAAVDVVCIFAANINQKPFNGDCFVLAPKTSVANGNPYLIGSPDYSTLTKEIVQKLQAKGITVLLSVLNNHDNTGWSEFQSQETATNFVQQLQEVILHYGLDGIDIDDEYSTGQPIESSLVMVTSIIKEQIPNIIISKALWNDFDYFAPVYNGKTLAQNLTYGWEMSYGGQPKYRLEPYLQLGMTKETLVCGFWSGQPSSNPSVDVSWLKSNGFEGVMVYAFQDQSNIDLLGSLVIDWNGAGNWNKLINCP